MSTDTGQRLTSLVFGGIRDCLPGLAMSSLVALAAAYAAGRLGAPVLLLALPFGALLRPAGATQSIAPGLRLCAGPLLRAGVALLGLRIAGAQLVALGWPTLAVVVAAVALTIGLGVLLGRAAGVGGALGALAGGATAICGASAALALSAVLPLGLDRDRATSAAVVTVSVLSTVAMILYPLIATALNLTPLQAGIFLGTSIHDVAQVMGAGYSLSEATGDTAALVKMVRVALLGPVIVVTGLLLGHRSDAGRTKLQVPAFVLAFFGLAALRSLGLVPQWAVELGAQASLALLIVATAALGLRLDILALRRHGGPVLGIGLACTFFLAAFAVGYVVLAGPEG